jgi:hypothetical protein
MRNYLTSKGLLQDGSEQQALLQEGAGALNTQVESMLPFVPQNPRELVQMQRTMVPTGETQLVGDKQVPTFVTPENAIYKKNKAMFKGLEQKATSDFERKVNNPFFKVGDFITDVARNTIGAIPNFFTDGEAFKADPSKKTVEGYKGRLQQLSDLQTANIQYFTDGRGKRAEALATAITGVNDITPSHYTANSLQEFQQTGNFDDLERYNNFETVEDKDTGAIYQLNKSNNEKTFLKTPEQAAADKAAAIVANGYNEQKALFAQNQVAQVSRLDEAKNSTANIQKQIQDARDIINKYPNATGWGSLLNMVPDTEATQLNALLRTLEANVAFKALQEMRANSPTGGALGNVSNVEIELLYQSLSPILQKGGVKELLSTLDTIENDATQTLDIYERAYTEDLRYYGGRENFTMRPDSVKIQSKETQNSQLNPKDLESNGYVLQQDADGNQAYVHPTTNDIVEVPQ